MKIEANKLMKMRIILVEDSPVCVQQLQHALAEVQGAEIVAVASTSAAACKWLAAHPDGWDAAIIDIFLASGHGFEVLRHCRERRDGQLAIVLSNYTRDPVREHARRAGADAVFDKSFEVEALVHMLSAVERRATA
jgi:DNA-binding NarL/FixJ family response regulator